MRFHVTFLLVGATLAAAQNFFWSFGSPNPTSKNDESSPSWNSFRAQHPLMSDPSSLSQFPSHKDMADLPSQFGVHQPDDGRFVEQSIESRGRYGSPIQERNAGRIFLAPFFPFFQNQVPSQSISVAIVTVSTTCIPFRHFNSAGSNATPCGAANSANKKKRGAVSEEEPIDPSKIQPLEPTLELNSVERSTRDVRISSSRDEEESVLRNPRLLFNNYYPVPSLYFTQTTVVTVRQVLAEPDGTAYLTCLPNGYFVCPN